MSEKTETDRSPVSRSPAAYLKPGIPLVTLAAMIGVGAVMGPAPAILVLAGGSLVGVIAMFWASLRTLFGETPLSGADAYALGAPRAEEEQKQAVLRALKDLEFERSVGKISEEDYQALVARYRAEAKRLLRVLDADAQPRRHQVEALVADHLRKEGLLDGQAEKAEAAEEPAEAPEEEAEAKAAEEPAAEAPKRQKKKKRGGKGDAEPKKPKDEIAALAPEEASEEPAQKEQVCSECGTINDADAVFCKKCGARQNPAQVTEPSASSSGDDAAKATDSEAGA
ncbi:MAG TPA: zinc ribbon domain-containing protein [Polyangiaceae bacterium]|nr:zinc ribbon domain-containing protein [Polyangiaceae bacterium]